MARLPTPGGDDGSWGTVLNDYLGQSLDTGGALKSNTVGASQIASNAVTNAAIADATISGAKLTDGSIATTKLTNAGAANGPALLDSSAKLTDTVMPDRLSAASLDTLLATLVPSGMIMPTARAAATQGWLMCDGAAISRTSYSALFAAIGTTYGVGDGSTTFNLPNLKGRTIVGVDAAQTEFDVFGETGGSKVSSHSHVLSDNGHAQIAPASPGGTDAVTARRISVASYTANYRYTGGATSNTANSSSVGTPLGGTTDSADSSTLQPYIALNYLIKT